MLFTITYNTADGTKKLVCDGAAQAVDRHTIHGLWDRAYKTIISDDKGQRLNFKQLQRRAKADAEMSRPSPKAKAKGAAEAAPRLRQFGGLLVLDLPSEPRR